METGPTNVGARYDLASPFLLAPNGTRLIQIQPTLRCNLRCLHCYSESGPERSGEIPVSRLNAFLNAARQIGYSYVGISGGEPLLWTDLAPFLELAQALRFSTSITTNGTLLTARTVDGLRGLTDLVAVSVDGPPADHAAIRGSSTAFSSMRKGLAVLRDAGVPFSLAFTLTRYNADRVKWLYEFADTEGAVAVHVHPLCDFGAANKSLSDAVPDSLEFKAAAWLLALVVEQRGSGGPTVTLDAIRLATVRRSCWPMLAPDEAQFRAASFCDLVPSLVVESDGRIVPFIYGFPRSWSIGVIDGVPLPQAIEEWRKSSANPLSTLIRSTIHRLSVGEVEYVDLFAELLAAAHRHESRTQRAAHPRGVKARSTILRSTH